MTDTASGSYFASLAKARYLLLTTFKQKGTPVSASVPGIVDGGRAYFQPVSDRQAANQFAGNHGSACAHLAFPARTARDGKRTADVPITLDRAAEYQRTRHDQVTRERCALGQHGGRAVGTVGKPALELVCHNQMIARRLACAL